MIAIEHDQTLDEVLNRIDSSLKTIKLYRTAMKNSLLNIKRAYTAEDFIHSQIASNLYESVCEKLKCSLDFDLETKILTMKSEIDPEFKISVKLLDNEAYFDYLKSLHLGIAKDDEFQMIEMTENQLELLSNVFRYALFWLDENTADIFEQDANGKIKSMPKNFQKQRIKMLYDFLIDRIEISRPTQEKKKPNKKAYPKIIYKEQVWKMLEIRKANKVHKCLICGKEIKPKKHYVHIDKQNADGSYKNGAICENCNENIIISKIEEE